MAHGRKDESDLLGVVPDIGRLFHDLGHDDHIGVLVGRAQCGEAGGQLVAQNQNEPGHQGTALPA